jgi:hypothetical protein
MGKLITAKIDVLKIQKNLLYIGKKGTYLNLNIWINDKPDNYGNEISIQQQTAKGEPVLYIGEGKFYVKKGEQKPDNKEGVPQKGTASMSDINDLPGANDNPDNLPF